MYCKNCGNDIGDAKFCPECGANQNEQSPKKRKWPIVIAVILAILIFVTILINVLPYLLAIVYYQNMIDKISDVEIPTIASEYAIE